MKRAAFESSQRRLLSLKKAQGSIGKLAGATKLIESNVWICLDKQRAKHAKEGAKLGLTWCIGS